MLAPLHHFSAQPVQQRNGQDEASPQTPSATSTAGLRKYITGLIKLIGNYPGQTRTTGEETRKQIALYKFGVGHR